mmetsp:Transcript_9799/g.41651  ORF Transcript_9799/g.41651 Transcript_9799/m.41651 type:complete len:253 (-) Transcript_9799:1317-2075(-)
MGRSSPPSSSASASRWLSTWCVTTVTDPPVFASANDVAACEVSLPSPRITADAWSTSCAHDPVCTTTFDPLSTARRTAAIIARSYRRIHGAERPGRMLADTRSTCGQNARDTSARSAKSNAAEAPMESPRSTTRSYSPEISRTAPRHRRSAVSPASPSPNPAPPYQERAVSATYSTSKPRRAAVTAAAAPAPAPRTLLTPRARTSSRSFFSKPPQLGTPGALPNATMSTGAFSWLECSSRTSFGETHFSSLK